MRKNISLFLAIIMSLSLCVTPLQVYANTNNEEVLLTNEQGLSDAKEKYISLLSGNYNNAQLRLEFIELFGDQYSNEYVRENYRTIFDFDEGEEIDEAFLDIITEYERVFDGEVSDVNALSFFSISNQDDNIVDNFPVDDLPVFEPAPEPELIIYPQNTSQSALETDGNEMTTEPNNFAARNTRALTAGNSFTSISFVSSTETSVTFDIWYKSGDDANNYLKKYDTVSWTNLLGQGAGIATSKRYTATGLKAGYVYTFRTGKYDWDAAKWMTAEIEVQTPTSKTNTLSLVGKTHNSITMKVEFPAEGIWGNVLKLYDNGSWISFYPDVNYGKSGTYTISNLSPGTSYYIYTQCYDFLPDIWRPTISMNVMTNIPPENLISYSKSNIDFTLDKVFTDTLGSSLTNSFLNNTNEGYSTMYRLVNGGVTYHAGKMKINHVRNYDMYIEGVAGTPIIWQLLYENAPYAYALDHARAMKNANVDTTETPFHEISHNFDNYKWEFEAEALAILKIYYHYSTTGQTMITAGDDPSFTGKQYKTYMKSYADRILGHINYDAAMTQNVYSPYTMAYTLGNIADQIGWDAFTQTFTYFYNLSYKYAPQDGLGKLNLFLSKLTDYSGVDVFSKLSSKEKAIFEAEFGGEIKYVDSRVTLVLIPGLMGSRLYYNGDKKWEPTAGEASWPLPNTYFLTDMKPFLLSDENDNPYYDLDANRKNDSDYGAKDTYQVIYEYLNNESNFPKTEYKVKFFTYDWRLSSSENAIELEDFIEEDDNVVLIAHSMGGLVSSSFLSRSTANRNKVNQLITFGTPYMGSAKAVEGFETGDLLGLLAYPFMASHMREISANTVSAYELLPTSRYGAFINKPNDSSGNTTLSYLDGMSFLKTRGWAKKMNEDVKPMFASSEAFHNSLFSSSSHVTSLVDTTYIIGTGFDTPEIAVYEKEFYPTKFSLKHFSLTSGDGTVVEKSARNGQNDYYPFSAKHTELVADLNALNVMKELIKGSSTTSLAIGLMGTHSANKEGLGDRISVVLQGLSDLTIHDSDGNEIIRDGESLYRINSDGSSTNVGTIWIIDAERLRYQYVLDPDEYTFDNLEFEELIIPEVEYMTFQNWNWYLSYAEYIEIEHSDNLQFNFSYDSYSLMNKETNESIPPTMVADDAWLQQMNSGK